MIENQKEINKTIENRESLAGTGTPTNKVTKIVENNAERLHEKENKRQRGNNIFLD